MPFKTILGQTGFYCFDSWSSRHTTSTICKSSFSRGQQSIFLALPHHSALEGLRRARDHLSYCPNLKAIEKDRDKKAINKRSGAGRTIYKLLANPFPTITPNQLNCSPTLISGGHLLPGSHLAEPSRVEPSMARHDQLNHCLADSQSREFGIRNFELRRTTPKLLTN